MRALRFFVRGLERMAVRKIVRRVVTRAAVRSEVGGAVRAEIGGAVRSTVMRDLFSPEIDGLVDDIADQIDVFELLDLATEVPQIISRARDAATAGSTESFNALMEQFNEGQKVLAQEYCVPYAEEYWETTQDPDPEEYLDGMYSQHEAIEQALSDACTMSYEAGRGAGVVSIAQDLGQYIAEELIAKGMDMAGVRRRQGNWGEFADDIRRSEMMGDFSGPGWLTRSGRRGNFGDSMYIGTDPDSMYRQLSGSQFMGADQPYWFTERRRMAYAAMQGHMTQEELSARTQSLYSSTYSRPWSTHRPPGYTPYSGPEWEYRGP